MGTRGRYEEKLPRIVLIFKDENSLRRVDCNNQNFHELMIFLVNKKSKVCIMCLCEFYENYEY